MNLKQILALSALVGITPLYAKQLTPEAAWQRATGDVTVNQTTPKRMLSHGAQRQLAYTATLNGENTFYVFNFSADKGFMLVSADDAAVPMLGYSDNGTFDANNIPENLRYWLDEYNRQISYGINHGVEAKQSKTAARKAIDPLLTTTWNQSTPYNNKCPLYNSSHMPTGCVATAMAQVMKYHNWPDTGVGNRSYGNMGVIRYLDFSAITYDWANMLDAYYNDGTYTEAQLNAIGDLMYSCGVATEMQYDESSSGTYNYLAAQAFPKYFKYDDSVKLMSRDYYTMTDWEEIVYNQLTNVGPVYYSGESELYGHAWVCDGYSDGYFHMNWGWGGVSDGYFKLSAMDPYEQGIGGSDDAYNYNQIIIADVFKEDGITAEPYTQFGIPTDMKLDQTTATLGSGISMTGVPVYNITQDKIIGGKIGFRITNNATGEKENLLRDFGSLVVSQNYYATRIYEVTLPSTLKEGTYTVEPIYVNTNGKEVDILVKVGCVSHIIMTVSGNTATFSAPVKEGGLTFSNLTPQSAIYYGKNFSIDADIANTSADEYYDEVQFALLSKTGTFIEYATEKSLIDVAGNSTANMSFVVAFDNSRSFTAGEYQIAVYDKDGNQISTPQTINVKTNTDAVSLAFSNISYNNGSKSQAYKRGFEMNFTVTCNKGVLDRPLSLCFATLPDGEVLSTLNSENLFLEPGESTTCKVTGNFNAGEVGKDYAIVFLLDNDQVSNAYKFTVIEGSGSTKVEAVDSDSIFSVYPNPVKSTATVKSATEISEIALYSLTGALMRQISNINATSATVDMQDLTSGIYLMRVSGANGVKTVRVVKE